MTVKKTKWVQVRMSEMQHARLVSESEEMGLNLSEYIRHVLSVYHTLQSHTAVTEG